MAAQNEPISRLVSELARLPGIGRKTAQRLAYYLLMTEDGSAYALSDAIRYAKDNIKFCSVCSNITDADPCGICSDTRRDQTLICVVSDAKDVLAVEKTKEFRGVYHVIGGAISPMQGISPENLHIEQLISRLTPEVKEVILATNLSVEGETTAMYIARLIAPLGIKTTRIAKGIPAGADLEYADETTLANALEGRKVIE